MRRALVAFIAAAVLGGIAAYLLSRSEKEAPGSWQTDDEFESWLGI